jgi:hypothetical protein
MIIDFTNEENENDVASPRNSIAKLMLMACTELSQS